MPGEEMNAVTPLWVSSPTGDEDVTPLFEGGVGVEGDAGGHGLRMFELAVEELMQEQDQDGPLLPEMLLEALAGTTEDEEEEILAAEALAAEVVNDQVLAGATPDDRAVVRKVPLPVPSIYHPREKGSIIEAPMVASLAAVFLWPTLLLLITICSTLLVTYFRVIRNIAKIVYRSTHETQEEEHNGDEMDVGLYWFGKGNICERAAEPGKPGRFFDPSKPSVIYVHGFQRRTTARRFRESFNWYHNDAQYGLDIDAADAWIEQGWNVGIFYWNRHADEETPQDSECKIWTATGRTGMRFRTVTSCGRVKYVSSPRPSGSISHQLCEILVATFANSTASYRLVGHSLGSQVVVHASKLLSQVALSDPRVVLPSRIALLDVFSTVGMKAYASGWPILVLLQRELAELRDLGVVLEQYQTSLIGRRGLRFQNLTAFVELDPPHIPWYKLKSRHIAAPYLYFLSMGEGVSPRQAELRRRASQDLVVRLQSDPSLLTRGDPVPPEAPSGTEVAGTHAPHDHHPHQPPHIPRHAVHRRHQRQRSHERVKGFRYQGLRAVFAWNGYKEVELGDFPAMARAHDEEVRQLMHSGYMFRQYRGRLFLRVARPW